MDYKGKLKISPELRASDIAYLKGFLGEDLRDHRDEWPHTDKYDELVDATNFIDVDFDDSFCYLQVDENTEKQRGITETMNYIISVMREKIPNFELSGSIIEQGDYVDEIYKIKRQDDGYFKHVKVKLEGDIICCPLCEDKFILKDEHRVSA